MLIFYLSMIETEEERSLFVDLYEKYRQSLFRYADCYLHDAQDSEDVVHDVFCLVAKDYMKNLLKKSDDKRRHFLFLCTRNRAINLVKCKSKLLSIDEMAERGLGMLDDPAQDPIDAVLADKELLEKAKAAVNTLDRRYSDVLWLHLDGYSLKDIAKIFNEKPETVKKRLYRSKLLLREAVGMKGGAA